MPTDPEVPHTSSGSETTEARQQVFAEETMDEIASSSEEVTDGVSLSADEMTNEVTAPIEAEEMSELPSVPILPPTLLTALSEANDAAVLPTPQTDDETFTITSQQQRVLRYLARRHMRNARIARRMPESIEGTSSREEVDQSEPPQESQALFTVGIAETVTSLKNTPTQPLLADTPENTPTQPLLADDAIRNTPTHPLIGDSAAEFEPPPASPFPNKQMKPSCPSLAPPPALPITPALVVENRDQVGTMPSKAPIVSPRRMTVQQRLVVNIASSGNTQLSPHAELLRRRRKLLAYVTRRHRREARAAGYRSSRRLWLSVTSVILTLLVLVLSLTGAGIYLGSIFRDQTLTDHERQVLSLRDLLPLDNLKMYDSRGVLIDQLMDQGIHTTITFEQIPSVVLDATIATEDKYFWTNSGVDIAAITRAALDDLRSGRIVEGGSTITQQLVKNLILGNETSLTRKLQEFILAPEVNSHYSKKDIITMYLNSIYYGEQAYGIDAAATIYFGLEDQPGHPAASQLDLAQAAMLAGLPSNPTGYDPRVHRNAALQRFQKVLDGMVNQQKITRVQALDAFQEGSAANFFKPPHFSRGLAPHFSQLVQQQLEQLFHLSASQLSRSGMSVYTTLDIRLQDKIQKIAQQHVTVLSGNNVTNAAEVLIDFHTGAILSLLGSIDYYSQTIDGQFNVATAYRQPGSSFKPYVYATAFEQGASPAQAIDDKALTIDLPGGDPPTYTPPNYDGRYHGHMTLRCALQNSLNIPAVKVLQHAGIDASIQTAKDMGITSYQGSLGYSLVLGGLGVRLLDHTSAMGTFANGGVHVGYYTINKVTFSNGKVWQHPQDPGKQVISPQVAYMMTSVLSDNESRLPEFGGCNVLQLYSNSQDDCYNGNAGAVRPAAAKTGTTTDFKDNWTVGYTTDYVMGVWTGNNNDSPMYGISGVQGAAPIWHDSLVVAEQNRPIQDFVNPGGLIQQEVTYPDGIKTTDWFLPGSVPTFTTPTPGATATPVGKPTGTPIPGNPPVPPPTTPPTQPYCPSNYTFAFSPPADTVQSPTPGWW